MNKTRASRSPTKLGTRTRPVTRSKSPRVPSEEREGREPAGKPPDSPRKSMSQSPRKSAKPKPQWSSSSRPVTKDSQRPQKSRPQTQASTRSNSIANKRCDEINSLSIGMLKTWLKDAKAQLKQTERYET